MPFSKRKIRPLSGRSAPIVLTTLASVRMWLEMRTVFETLSTDSSVRAVMLSGAGPKAFTAGLDVQAASAEGPLAGPKAFTAGLDVQAASAEGPLAGSPGEDAAVDGARAAAKIRRHIAEFQDCVTAVERCEKPVICVLHGYALGLAIDLASCADVRLCARGTAFAVKEVDIGLAADVGTLSRLPKIVGAHSWVKDVCLTARTFGADEALRVGFVSGVFESKEGALGEALRIAALVAGKSPVAVQGTKELMNYSRDHTVQDGRWNLAPDNHPVLLLILSLQDYDIRGYGTAHRCNQRTLPRPCKLECAKRDRLLRSYESNICRLVTYITCILMRS